MARLLWFISVALPALVFLNAAQSSASIAVMSVDLGSEFMKLALVKPGVAMEIVLNKETKRKTPVVVAFKGQERFFGEAAQSKCVWSPETCFVNLHQLLGKNLSHPLVQQYRELNPQLSLIEDEATGRVAFRLPDDTIYNVEQLMAMLLRHAKQLVDDFAHTRVVETVITVPPYYTQAERLSMIQAAHMADLKLLQLMNDNAAAALNYGVFRRADFSRDKQHTVLIYDMGASGTRASVVEYHLVRDADGKEIPQLNIKGLGYDRTLGSSEMQLRLQRVLGERFEVKHKLKLTPKALIKLAKEAKRVKEVLSANINYVAQVEGLINDIDLREPIDRPTFENACADLRDRVAAPAVTALAAAGIKPDELDLFIVIGGGVRTPFVQNVLKDVFKVSELAKVLNGDEAVALGAVYQAAHLGRGFRVQPFDIHEWNLYPIQVEFESFNSNSSSDAETTTRMQRRMLFDRSNPFPQRKVLTVSRSYRDNFNLTAVYNLTGHDAAMPSAEKPSGVLELFEIRLKNVTQVFAKYADLLAAKEAAEAAVDAAAAENSSVLTPSAVTKGVRAHFQMDGSGMFSLAHVDATFEVKKVIKEKKPIKRTTLEAMKDTLAGIFDTIKGTDKTADSNDSANDQDVVTTVSTPPAEAENSTENATRNSSENTEKNSELEQVDKVVEIQQKEPVKFDTVRRDWIETNAETLKKWRKALDELDEIDRKKIARETAHNHLEAFVFRAQEDVDHEKYTSVSRESDRQSLREKIQNVATWLEDETEFQEVSVYEKKLASLKKEFDKMHFRISEAEARPKALKDFDSIVNSSRMLLESWKALPNLSSIFGSSSSAVKNTTNGTNIGDSSSPIVDAGEKHLLDFSKLLDETQEWRNRRVDKQEKLNAHDDPVLTSADIFEKVKSLTREAKYLLNKVKFAASKKQAADAAAAAKAAKPKINILDDDEMLGTPSPPPPPPPATSEEADETIKSGDEEPQVQDDDNSSASDDDRERRKSNDVHDTDEL